MPTETKPWDSAELLTTQARVAACLEEVFAGGDPTMIAKAIGAVARARNVAAIARETNLSRDTIYSAFGDDGNPRLSTLLAVTKALGFRLSVSPIAAE